VAKAATVAILGTRYADLSIEEEVFGPRGVRIVKGAGKAADDIVAQAAGAAVVMAGADPRFDGDVIERLSCGGIVRYGVGIETIDLDAASRAGMWVAFVPDYGTDPVALHAVTLLLAAIRRLPAADAIVKAGGWGLDGLRPLHTPMSLTVGIVGLGRIGRRVAELLAPFGFQLLGHDPQVQASSLGVRVEDVSFERLLTRSDAITLHVPGDPGGDPLLGAAELARMKEGAVIVNTARGSLIDQEALHRSLRDGRIGMAALDVFETEPPGPRFEDVGDRTILTPHMAWYTEESELDLRMRAAREALRIIDGVAPENVAARPLEVT
jgi:D-3-phosphoglycerate dehydrogenase / 2-oxoglutarate reductase